MTTDIPLSSDDLGMFFDDRHQELAARLRGLAGDIDSAVVNAGAKGVSQELARLGDLLSWVVLGEAIDVRALCLIRELLGYVSPLTDAVFAASALGAYCLSQTNHDGRWSDLIARYRAGEVVFGFALSEPDAGSDAASLQTQMDTKGQGYVVSGTKRLISNAAIATHYIVFATVDRKASHRGITAVIVEAESEGLRAEPVRLNVAHPIGNLHLLSCPIGPDAVLGPVGGGFRLAMQVRATFRPTVGAAAVGMAQRAYAEARAHVRERVQFGKTLAETQLVQSQLAEMATQLDAARLLVLRAAFDRDHGAGKSTGSAMAKWYATEAAQQIVDRAVQLLGGQGVIAEMVVERLYRAVRPLRIYEGTTEIQKLIIGRHIARE